jgi:hypothetical protein
VGLASTPSVKRRRTEPEADSEKVNRKSTFTTKLYQRDNHCVVTRDCLSVEGAHILAHAWWTPTDKRRLCLPKEVIDAVKDFPDEIDDVSNGLLLRTDLARSFDKGYFSLQLDEEKQHYRVVSLHPLRDGLDGIILDENTSLGLEARRLRCDGQTWWGRIFPSPTLVAFHLRIVCLPTWLQLDLITLKEIGMTLRWPLPFVPVCHLENVTCVNRPLLSKPKFRTILTKVSADYNTLLLCCRAPSANVST